MTQTSYLIEPNVVRHECDHRGTEQIVGSTGRCTACGYFWTQGMIPPPHVWLTRPWNPFSEVSPSS